MKCRLKKKAEFEKLKDDFNLLKEQKIILNQQVSTTTILVLRLNPLIFKYDINSSLIQYQQAMMLYEDKVKENGQLKDKLDQIQQI